MIHARSIGQEIPVAGGNRRVCFGKALFRIRFGQKMRRHEIGGILDCVQAYPEDVERMLSAGQDGFRSLK